MAAEKKGHLVRLEYNFNTAGVLEVFLKNEKWYRVTSSNFRSFDGKRRITEPTETIHGDVWNVKMRTYDYEGPVYLWGTNNTVPYKGTGEIISGSVREEFDKISGSRG